MKLSQEQTEGKLPEPAAVHSQAGEQQKKLDISGRSRHVRGAAPPPHHRRGGQLWAGKMGTRRLPSLQLAYLR